MSKRRMRNTGLVSTTVLLVIALLGVAATNGFAEGRTSPGDSVSCQLSFDSLSLRVTGDIEADVLRAPAISLNKHAAEFSLNYIRRNEELLQKIKERSPRAFRIIDGVFTRYKLPLELKYLAVIESELKAKALSRVGARGPWQLMPETARILALRVDAKHDERTHLYKSTVAVAKYLRDLYQLFGDWTLVIAAYNAGPGKVYSAIKKSGSRNFWKLQQYLPAETRGHVKKYIGTHYYFEGRAGATTMTKEETVAYRKAVSEFVARHNAIYEEKKGPEPGKDCEPGEEVAITLIHPKDETSN